MTAREPATDTEGRLVQVLATSSIPEGLLAKSLLEAEGILVVTKGESEGPYRIGPVYLWVPEQYEVQARVILAEVTAGSRDTRSDSMETEETTGQS